MKRGIYQRAVCALCAAALLGGLSGCSFRFRGVEELYALPVPSEDWQSLQVCLKSLQEEGEQIAPVSGDKIQQVQLQDLDGDSVKEAVAFFRMSNDERPLKIYLFRRVNDEYRQMALIEGAGSAIQSIAYEDMDGDREKEIVVSWQISDQVRSVEVFDLERDGAVSVLRTDDYVDFRLFDMDMDNRKELLVFQAPRGDELHQALLFRFENGVLELNSAAPFSQGIDTTQGNYGITENGLKTGCLTDLVPAVFVASYYGEGATGHITDVFAMRDGRLENITLDPNTGESTQTIRWYTGIYGSDINNDYIMELPHPVALPDPKRPGSAANFWAIHWRQYSIDGSSRQVFTTYHNDRDGWYLILPDQWEGRIGLERRDLPGGGERGVVFSHIGDDGSAVPFLAVYRLTGSSKERRAAQAGRFLLLSPDAEDDALYAAQFLECGWDCGLDEDGLKANFHLIRSDGT